MIRYNKLYWLDCEHVLQKNSQLLELKKCSILITGATGMLCSSVVELLIYMNQKYNSEIEIILAGRDEVRLKKRFIGIPEEEYIFIKYDALKEINNSFQADYIIHGASNANPVVYKKEPVETMLANFIGLNNILNIAKKQDVKRVLYISSSEIYGENTTGKPYKENEYGFIDILNLRACYPSAKRASETLCIAYGEEYGVDTIIARPGHIYGPTITREDSRASAQFIWNCVDGSDIIMKSSGLQVRSYCYTMDCATAILTILLKGNTREAYNISNSNSIVSIKDMAKALSKASGNQILFKNSSDNEKETYNMMSNSALISSKLEALGWKACFTIEEGINRTIEVLADK